VPGFGGGSFGSPEAYPVGPSPQGLVIADLNLDGVLDLVTANLGTGLNSTVSVLMGRGDRTVDAPLDFPVGAAPASVVAADLNVLPTAVVQRIEVLREGASSIYGSDAIAGVINIITDTSVNGLTLDGYADAPLAGGGDTIRGSATWGKTFSRGHILLSAEYREFAGLRANQRSAYSCPRDLFYQNGQEVGQRDPATGQLRCFPFAFNDSLGIASGYGIGFNFTNGALNRFSFPGYATGNPTIGSPVIVDGNDLRPSPSSCDSRRSRYRRSSGRQALQSVHPVRERPL